MVFKLQCQVQIYSVIVVVWFEYLILVFWSRGCFCSFTFEDLTFVFVSFEQQSSQVPGHRHGDDDDEQRLQGALSQRECTLRLISVLLPFENFCFPGVLS